MYYSPKLRQELPLKQICSQTGLPPSVPEQKLVELGFYPVIDPHKNSWVFADPPSELKVVGEVCHSTPTVAINDLEVVRERALELVWETGMKQCLLLLRNQDAWGEETLVRHWGFPECPYPRNLGNLPSRIEDWKVAFEGVKSARSIEEIRNILVKHELFSLSA